MRAPLALVLVLLAGGRARADDGLRCGEWLITVGKPEAEVAAKCGAPTAAERYELSRRRRRSVVVDVWTYDRGPRDFVRTLRFEDGVLTSVEVGEYGHQTAH